jgi:hypothetical protein
LTPTRPPDRFSAAFDSATALVSLWPFIIFETLWPMPSPLPSPVLWTDSIAMILSLCRQVFRTEHLA